MIKFFRHIRKQLLGEGKTGKYLKYAIGEIILVMIGILLALQVNNWNLDRINKTKASNYLSEIRSNLITDTLQINEVLEFNIQKTQAILACIQELGSPETPFNRISAIGLRMNILPNYNLFDTNDI